MNLQKLDLNLLVVLRQLLHERHVSRAAEALDMSQPAASRALARLREQFDDPLLVRTPQGYDLSARASSLMPKLDLLLEQAGQLVADSRFDPASTQQTVRFYGPEPEVDRYLPPLFARMRELAPHMHLQVFSDPQSHFELLEKGEVHFVLSPLQPDSGTAQLRSLKLRPVHIAALMRADHPLASGRMSARKYLAAAHGLVSLTGRGSSMLEKALRKQGLLEANQSLDFALQLNSFNSVANFCEQSDIVFHLPRSFAEQLARGRKLVVKDPLPRLQLSDLSVSLYWHERFHNDPMCQWVREQLRHTLAQR